MACACVAHFKPSVCRAPATGDQHCQAQSERSGRRRIARGAVASMGRGCAAASVVASRRSDRQGHGHWVGNVLRRCSSLPASSICLKPIGRLSECASRWVQTIALARRCPSGPASLRTKKSLDRDMQSIWALTTWAGPGEILVTAELRDRMANGLDADFEDLGHRAGRPDQMVRLFHARPRCSDTSHRAAAVVGSDPRPGLAVMPFRALA